jgi:hypothetical protein
MSGKQSQQRALPALATGQVGRRRAGSHSTQAAVPIPISPTQRALVGDVGGRHQPPASGPGIVSA